MTEETGDTGEADAPLGLQGGAHIAAERPPDIDGGAPLTPNAETPLDALDRGPLTWLKHPFSIELGIPNELRQDVMDQRIGEQIEARHTEEIDLAAARRWARILRRIDRVEFVGAGSYALVHGAAHRLPMTRRVPIRAARGLVALGYPATERVAA